ncbi:MAG: hypothetical protein IH885_10890 [Myxococcales bacterium]|nr:hypothetical protein [Myxococcales bacterium]
MILSVVDRSQLDRSRPQCSYRCALRVGGAIQQTSNSASFLTGAASLRSYGLRVLIQPDHRAIPTDKVRLSLSLGKGNQLIFLHPDQPLYGFDQAGQSTDQFLSASALGLTNIFKHALKRSTRSLLRRLGRAHLVPIDTISCVFHLSWKLALLTSVSGALHGGSGLRVRVLKVLGTISHIFDRLSGLLSQVALTLFDAVKFAALLPRQFVGRSAQRLPAELCGVRLQLSLLLKQILELARRHPRVFVAIEQRDQIRQFLAYLLLGFDDRAILIGRLANLNLVEFVLALFVGIARLTGSIASQRCFIGRRLIASVGRGPCRLLGLTRLILAALNLLERLIRSLAGEVQQIADLLQ